MSTPSTVILQLQSDLLRANEATGSSDTTIHDAISSLISGYGDSVTIPQKFQGEYTPTGNNGIPHNCNSTKYLFIVTTESDLSSTDGAWYAKTIVGLYDENGINFNGASYNTVSAGHRIKDGTNGTVVWCGNGSTANLFLHNGNGLPFNVKCTWELYDLSGVIQESQPEEEFIGIKYSAFDEETGLPTVADARSLGRSDVNSTHNCNGLFWNSATNGGLGIKLKDVYLPENTTRLQYTFQNCVSLENIYGNLDKVAMLSNSFFNCKALVETPCFPNLTHISDNAFRNCDLLTTVKLGGKVTSFGATAFNNCPNVTDIYVTWAEGEVANAPWGAPTTATIHYNTTYDENGNPITETV